MNYLRTVMTAKCDIIVTRVNYIFAGNEEAMHSYIVIISIDRELRSQNIRFMKIVFRNNLYTLILIYIFLYKFNLFTVIYF